MDSINRVKNSAGTLRSSSNLSAPEEQQSDISSNQNSATIRDYATTITILESISDAIFILNTKGRVEYANKSALSLLGATLESLIDRFIDEIVVDRINTISNLYRGNGKKREDNSEIIDRIESGVFGNIEAVMIFNYNIVPVLLDFSVVRDSLNEVRYIIVTAKDISQWKVLEKELKQQQALSVSRDRLRALGELSVGIIHDLAQPLTSLRLTIELMQGLINRKNREEQLGKNLNDMLRLVDIMSKSIDEIRVFANQTEDDTIGMVNIKDTLDKAYNMVSYELNQNDIRVRIKCDDDLPFLIANQLLLIQAFVNLFTNAKEAFNESESIDRDSDEKEINITVESCEDKWIKITFRDNAGGIEEKIRDRIFDPFFTTKKPYSNSGVGLSISKSIITSLGGDIHLEVGKEVGSVFKVRIPIRHKEEQVELFNLIEMLQQS